jgi:hypothetical protein
MILVRNLLAEAAILLYIGTKKEHQEKSAGGMCPSLRWGDAREGIDVAAMSAAVGGVCAAQTKRAGGFPPAPFLCILRSALRAGDVCQIDLEAWAHGRADRHAADIFAL